jgi:hypothetical protein
MEIQKIVLIAACIRMLALITNVDRHARDYPRKTDVVINTSTTPVFRFLLTLVSAMFFGLWLISIRGYASGSLDGLRGPQTKEVEDEQQGCGYF